MLVDQHLSTRAFVVSDMSSPVSYCELNTICTFPTSRYANKCARGLHNRHRTVPIIPLTFYIPPYCLSFGVGDAILPHLSLLWQVTM